MVSYIEGFDEIQNDFERKGIPTDKVGFYDHPSFVELERQNHISLENYARYVQTQTYSDDYLERANRIIRIVAEELNAELLEDGRIGACADTSIVFSKILEEQKVWNYMVGGTLTIIFPPEYNVPNPCRLRFDFDDNLTPHVWVAAPPFNIIDISIKLQGYNFSLPDDFPKIILQQQIEIPDINPLDIFFEQRVDKELRQGKSEKEIIFPPGSDWKEFFNTFPANLVSVNRVKLKYIPCRIKAVEPSSLKEITSLRLNERYGIDIYNQRIKPKLKEHGLLNKLIV